MAEEKQFQSTSNVDVLLKRVDEFQKTVTNLLQNISTFRTTLLDNKKKFGIDISKWPQQNKQEKK